MQCGQCPEPDYEFDIAVINFLHKVEPLLSICEFSGCHLGYLATLLDEFQGAFHWSRHIFQIHSLLFCSSHYWPICSYVAMLLQR